MWSPGWRASQLSRILKWHRVLLNTVHRLVWGHYNIIVCQQEGGLLLLPTWQGLQGVGIWSPGWGVSQLWRILKWLLVLSNTAHRLVFKNKSLQKGLLLLHASWKGLKKVGWGNYTSVVTWLTCLTALAYIKDYNIVVCQQVGGLLLLSTWQCLLGGGCGHLAEVSHSSGVY